MREKLRSGQVCVPLGDDDQCAGGTPADGLGDLALDALLVKRLRQRPRWSLIRPSSATRALRANGGEKPSCGAPLARRSPADERPTPTLA